MPATFDSLSLAQLAARIRSRVELTHESRQPAFTMLIGSGFSVPLIPTASGMLEDIPWWLFNRSARRGQAFGERPRRNMKLRAFQKKLWKAVGREEAERATQSGDEASGASNSDTVGKSYRAIMCGGGSGLSDPQLRRGYLRAVDARVGSKVNGAHIFLASILRAQGHWRNKWSPFCQTIFTTNFDPLLQRSLQLVNRLYYMTDRPEALETPVDDDTNTIHIVYSHGSIHRYLLLNTDQEIEQGRKANAPGLVGYFERHGVLAIGYSGWPDAIMGALEGCRSFDGNLYWCGMHTPEQAEKGLTKRARDLLEKQRGVAFYVPIPGADEAMRAIHQALGLGNTPKFLSDPVTEMITNLKNVEVSSISRQGLGRRPIDTLDRALARTLQKLEAAQAAFDHPEELLRAPGERTAGTARAAIIASTMIKADVVAEKDPKAAIRLWTKVIKDSNAVIEDKTTALLNRGYTWGELRKTKEELADYAAAIRMRAAPSEIRAQCLINRSVVHSEQGRVAAEVKDLEAVMRMPDAPAEQKAEATLNRGIVYGDAGERAREIAAYGKVIGTAGASAALKARARFYRGVELDARGKSKAALADFKAVIDTAGAAPEDRAEALSNRGALSAARGATAAALADYDAALAIPGVADAERARILYNRAVSYQDDANRYAEAIADFSALIAIRGVPPEDRAEVLALQAEALGLRGWLLYEDGNPGGMVTDARRALALEPKLEAAQGRRKRPKLTWIRFQLAIGLLAGERIREARETYGQALKQCRSVEELGEHGIEPLEVFARTPSRPERQLGEARRLLERSRVRERQLTSLRRSARKRANHRR